MTNTKKFPIDEILPQLKDTLLTNTGGVLVAPPGAGKSTRVPLALLTEPWLNEQRILILEPRRLAATATARFMAASLGEAIGETVGYRVRLDTRVGPKTRIEVITEGILTRLLQSDAALAGVGLVIFDEFHERNLQADLGLALCLEAQAFLRTDLRLLIMSATLDAKPVAAIMGDVPILISVGRSFPVDTIYLERRADTRIELEVTKAIFTALKDQEGDILAFLPGVGEIRRVAEQVKRAGLEPGIRLTTLYGSLSLKEQDAAILPSLPGQRKIVLATSVAETSLTVEGVKVVIDSGLMRVSRFSPRTGMSRLDTITVSRSSADQRRGRAGREGPGVCYRLWSAREDLRLDPENVPEVYATDLAPLALELAVWGVTDPKDLRWLDLPPAAAFSQARDLLITLGALTAGGKVTEHGRRMVAAGLHPRLAHMILRAIPLGLGHLACVLAALLTGRELFQHLGSTAEVDLRQRVEALLQAEKEPIFKRLWAEVKYLWRGFHIPPGGIMDVEVCGVLLAFAYPDRIAQYRSPGRFLLSGGRGATISTMEPLSAEAYLVAAELDDQGVESRIYQAAPVKHEDLMRCFQDEIQEETVIAWDRTCQAVRSRQRVRLGALILKERPGSYSDAAQVVVALIQGIREEGLDILPWTRAVQQFRQRLQFMHNWNHKWPSMADDTLAVTLEEWLGPYLYGMTSREDLKRLDLMGVLKSWLSWEKQQELDEYAPSHILVPSGQRIPIDYSDPDSPMLAVRLQEMFGLTETPVIANGAVPLTIHLLSPAYRPVQVTKDLPSFWNNTYFEVRKDLMGRYPKHYWPDDPLKAKPTNRIRPRD